MGGPCLTTSACWRTIRSGRHRRESVGLGATLRVTKVRNRDSESDNAQEGGQVLKRASRVMCDSVFDPVRLGKPPIFRLYS
jgi:hypothetical protein